METKTTRQDMERIRALLGDLIVRPQKLPVSFTYAGKAYAGMPEGGVSKSRLLDANMVETTLTARLDENVRVTAEIVTYRDYPAVEWTLWFENDGASPGALLKDLKAADLRFCGASPRLISNNGDFYSIEGYTNTTTALPEGVVFEQAPRGGRACDGAFPYQRLLFDDYGVNIAIGWPGQWACRWEGTGRGARFTAGQQEVRTVIKPGERFRSPRMAFVSFEGGLERGVNVWRRWYRDHVLPRAHGKPFPSMVQVSDNGGGVEWTIATESQQLEAVKAQAQSGIGAELWWIDAGWYPCMTDGEPSWPQTGTWEPDASRFPRGLKPVGDACKAAGMELVVWFEPERVRPNTWLSENHPEWMLRRNPETRAPGLEEENMLLDLTQPACLKWLCEHISKIINESGITVYRQDFNFEPLLYWRDNESEDRRGMVENLYIQGYLAYWDYLLIHTPNLMIDSCASGGRRNDLETMRRGVPFHQTDFGYGHHPIKQKFSQLLYSWIPYFRGFCASWDDDTGEYILPSYYAPPAHPSYEEFDMFNTFAPMMNLDSYSSIADKPEVMLRQADMVALYKRIRHHLTEDDFYALTEQHNCREKWSAWQFYRPESGEGLVQFFRNNGAPEERFTAQLRGLCPDAVYVFTNGRTGERREMSGRAAMTEGFVETLEKRRASLWIYRLLR